MGQLMMFGIEGTGLTPEIRSFLRETNVGGVILFGRNIVDARQLSSFIRDLKEAAPEPLIVAVDQEGGRVARLKGGGFTKVPPMAQIGQSGDETLAYRIGQVFGEELSQVGFNIDFAPVLDVATNAFNPVIGDRSFSHEADVVARFGVSFIRGIQSKGVAACAKHFPGHGDTDVDSHLGLPLLNHTRRRLDVCELVPFHAAVDAGVAAMMTAHIMIPNLDPDFPVTISRRITTDILKGELNFNGLVFTDDLTMAGIAGIWLPQEVVWRAVAAGADIAMVCHKKDKQLSALEGLRRAVGEGWIDEKRIAAALAHVADFKARFC